MKRRTKWILWPSVGLLVLVVGGYSCLGRGKGEVLYTTEAAKRQDLRESVSATGEIQAKTKVNVGTAVGGEIKEIHVKDGQWVKTGDLLVTLDQERFRQQFAQAEFSLKQSRQDLKNAEATFAKQQATFQRQETLHRQGILSNEDFQTAKLTRENAENSLERSKVSVQQAQAQLALAQDSLSKVTIRATMPGRVTGLQAEKGETAIAGQTNIAGAVLMVISDMSEMLAEMKVGELDVVKLKEGAPAEVQVDALPGRTFQGKVVSVATAADRTSRGGGGFGGGSQDSQNYKVRVQLTGTSEELSALRPGMSCRVAALALEAKNVLTVPIAAIQEREEKKKEGAGLLSQSRTVVYVLKDGKSAERVLKTGLVTRKAVQVLEGVSEGDVVITGPTKSLTNLGDGMSVKTASRPVK